MMDKVKLAVGQIVEWMKETLKFKGLFSEFDGFLDYFLIDRYYEELEFLADEYLQLAYIVEFGGSEGVYLDVYLEGDTGDGRKKYHAATIKTLKQDNEAFLKMSRLGALLDLCISERGYIKLLEITENTCLFVDSWTTDDDTYTFVQCIDDQNVYLCEVNKDKDGHDIYEYDYLPTREIIEEDYLVRYKKQRRIIDDTPCLVVSTWENTSKEEKYILGQVIDDLDFFRVDIRCETLKDHSCLEYDHLPTQEEVESDYVDLISARALDEYEAEYGADGRRVFPHLNDDKEEDDFKSDCYEAFKLQWMLNHGYSLTDYLDIVTDLAMEEKQENPDAPSTYIEDVVKKRFMEVGFGNGICFPLKKEFLNNEFLDADYMDQLFSTMAESEKEKAFYQERFGC